MNLVLSTRHLCSATIPTPRLVTYFYAEKLRVSYSAGDITTFCSRRVSVVYADDSFCMSGPVLGFHETCCCVHYRDQAGAKTRYALLATPLSQKSGSCHYTFARNFTRYWPVFNTCSPQYFVVNLLTNSSFNRGVPKGYKGIYTPKLPKLDLATDAAHGANLVDVNIWLQTSNSAVYYPGMLYQHNNIFLADIICCDRLKFG